MASCTSSPEGVLDVGNASFAAAPDITAAPDPAHPAIATAQATATDTTTAQLEIRAGDGAEPLAAPASETAGLQAAPITPSEPGSVELPIEVAYLPHANPAAPAAEAAATVDATAEFPPAPEATAAPAQAATDAALTEMAALDVAAPAPGDAPLPQSRPDAVASAESGADAADSDPAPLPAVPAVVAAAPVKRQQGGFLNSLFGSSKANAAPAPRSLRSERDGQPVFENRPKPVIAQQPVQPVIEMAAAAPAAEKPRDAAAFGNDGALPGVRQSALFEIRRKSGVDDDSDVDLHEDGSDDGYVQLASAAGMARLAPNGLLTQTDKVEVGCLKPSLVRMLKAVESRYKRPIVVTSGYRSVSHNRRARGAKNSLHMYCAAADVQVEGVSKWELARFVRSMPGRGGVGTYCHTNSVHIDVGPERDWNWRCRRRR